MCVFFLLWFLLNIYDYSIELDAHKVFNNTESSFFLLFQKILNEQRASFGTFGGSTKLPKMKGKKMLGTFLRYSDFLSLLPYGLLLAVCV